MKPISTSRGRKPGRRTCELEKVMAQYFTTRIRDVQVPPVVTDDIDQTGGAQECSYCVMCLECDSDHCREHSNQQNTERPRRFALVDTRPIQSHNQVNIAHRQPEFAADAQQRRIIYEDKKGLRVPGRESEGLSLPVHQRIYAAQGYKPGVRRGVPLAEKEKRVSREVVVGELHDGESSETGDHDKDMSVTWDCQCAPAQDL
jgi:hypothetical protein